MRVATVLLAMLLALPAASFGQGIEMRQGSVYAYPVPAGWVAHDGSNGVDMQSPDGSAFAYALVLARQPGAVSAQQLVQFTLQNVGYQDIRVADGRTWQGGDGRLYCGVQYFALYRGMQVQGQSIASTVSQYGVTDGEVRGFHTARWEGEAQALATLLENVRVTNTGGFAGQASVQLPGNNPLGATYGRYQASAAERDRVRDQSSQGWQAGMLGRERTRDPQTGRTYSSPLETFDATLGGYRNPAPGRGGEVLQKTAPGE